MGVGYLQYLLYIIYTYLTQSCNQATVFLLVSGFNLVVTGILGGRLIQNYTSNHQGGDTVPIFGDNFAMATLRN